MKLKCKHKRRVMIIRETLNVLHRSDGSRCDDLFPKIGSNSVELHSLVMWGPQGFVRSL